MASNKQRKSRGMVLGLALTAMLAFGALSAGAAQAVPTWHINGTPFLGEETFEAESTGIFQIDVPGLGVTFNCEVGGTASSNAIFGGSEGEATLSFSECKAKNAPKCKAKPLLLPADSELVQVAGVVYEKFHLNEESRWDLQYCGLHGSFEISGSLAARVGPEAVEPTLTFSQAAMKAAGTSLWLASQPIYPNVAMNQMLTGENAGQEWGAA